MGIRQDLYYNLVDRIPSIKQQYLDYLQASPRNKVQKYSYLAYLHGKRALRGSDYTVERLPFAGSESAASKLPAPKEFADALEKYDVVSFDVFDTLLFRPFGRPTDVFHLVGEELKYLNYAQIREQMETKARRRYQEAHGTPEVTLREIYSDLSFYCGLDQDQAMEAELATERKLLYANPYMREVFRLLRKKKMKLVAVTDTYFSRVFIEDILKNNGYDGFEEIFVSCEQRSGKWDGSIFDIVKKWLGNDAKIIHIGDNLVSDCKMPAQKGIFTKHYQNINTAGNKYRPINQSAIIGAAYRGIVNGHLHNGMGEYTPLYEYGYSVGGILAVGYCSFIKEYVDRNKIDKVLFLARDGDILKKVYDYLFPDENTVYVYWSRAAAAKLGARYYQYDYLRRFIDHKVGKGIPLARVIDTMGLKQMQEAILGQADLLPQDLLTYKTESAFRSSVLASWSKILEHYQHQHVAAQGYFRKILGGAHSAVTVDVGWAGSGGMILSWLIEDKWNIPCKLTGLVAGTNTPYNDEPNASEAFLCSRQIEAYLFSQSHNRDLWQSHVPQKMHNLYMELLFSSPTSGFLGFHAGQQDAEDIFAFAAHRREDASAAEEIQRGILEFVKQYSLRFKDYPYMLRISGSDAYAPFAAAAQSKSYFRKLTKGLEFEEDVVGAGKRSG